MGNGPLVAVMGSRAGEELDIESDLDTDRPMSMCRAQQLKAAAGLIQSRSKAHG